MSKGRNWKEQVLVEYAGLVERIGDTTRIMGADPELDALAQERAVLDHKIGQVTAGYQNTIKEAQRQQGELREKLIKYWDVDGKTFKSPAGTATLRITRSLQVKDKEKLIEFLTTLKKLPEFIKTFEIAKLRKIKDAGLLEDKIATYDDLRTVLISIKETNK